MKRTKQEKAITLVALIITIIVLLILAVVTIAAITGDGDLISHANNAKQKYTDEAAKENSLVQSYLTKMPEENGTEGNNEENQQEETGENNGNNEENQQGGETPSTLAVVTAKTAGTVYASNTQITDAYGNKITIPAGFKIASDSGENVTQGIVIEDVNNENAGSQFVWVPCGTIYTNAAKTESKTITLSRYTFDSSTGTPTAQGDAAIKAGSYNNYQELARSGKGNTTAKDIDAFKTSVANNGGYYIGRYEAGDSSALSARSSSTDGTLVCKANQEVYNYIAQPNAATKCKSMYTSSNFTSDLINSYAWDTAIVYIQEFSGETNYANENKSTGLRKTGINPDKYCNIYDMSGNVWELTTETYSDSYCPCGRRGGYYRTDNSLALSYTSNRSNVGTSGSSSTIGFRPLLYV